MNSIDVATIALLMSKTRLSEGDSTFTAASRRRGGSFRMSKLYGKRLSRSILSKFELSRICGISNGDDVLSDSLGEVKISSMKTKTARDIS